jgi:hypothetical protein
MAIPILNMISSVWKRETRQAPSRKPLVLAGIYQNVFLNQWGTPDIRISLDHLEGIYKRDTVAINTDTPEEVHHSVWIYKEKDRIFFFTGKRLVSHFRWSDFKEKRKRMIPVPQPESIKRSPIGPAAVMTMVA